MKLEYLISNLKGDTWPQRILDWDTDKFSIGNSWNDMLNRERWVVAINGEDVSCMSHEEVLLYMKLME